MMQSNFLSSLHTKTEYFPKILIKMKIIEISNGINQKSLINQMTQLKILLQKFKILAFKEKTEERVKQMKIELV